MGMRDSFFFRSASEKRLVMKSQIVGNEGFFFL